MKFEELVAKCPECGSTDKVIKRRLIDNHRAHAELKSIVCEKCGYVFDDGEGDEPEEIQEKHDFVTDLNQKLL